MGLRFFCKNSIYKNGYFTHLMNISEWYDRNDKSVLLSWILQIFR
jgi:hypothetical protein